MSLNLSTLSLEVCVCNFTHKKVKNGGTLIMKLQISMCLIKSVILVLPFQEESIFLRNSYGENIHPGSVTSGINSFFV